MLLVEEAVTVSICYFSIGYFTYYSTKRSCQVKKLWCAICELELIKLSADADAFKCDIPIGGFPQQLCF